MSTTKKEVVEIYTDGGCRPNPGIGGWAVVMLYREKRKELSGGEMNTTNNRMELTAAVRALEALRRPCTVVLHTDSEYLRRGITEWLKNWKRKGWKTTTGPVKNRDLWEHLDKLIEKHAIDWKWVAGHSGHEHNDRCDELATEAIERLKLGE